MELVQTRRLADAADVLLGHAAARYENDAPVSLAVEPGQQVDALLSLGLLARGENAVKAQGDHVFQCLLGVYRAVKCTMASHTHSTAALDEVTVFLEVKGAVGVQAAEYHTVNAQLAAHLILDGVVAYLVIERAINQFRAVDPHLGVGQCGHEIGYDVILLPCERQLRATLIVDPLLGLALERAKFRFVIRYSK